MRRQPTQPREDWRTKVEKLGLLYLKEGECWNEEACYEFTAEEVETLEEATNALDKMCLEAAQYVIENRLYDLFAIPPEAVPIIESSWSLRSPAIYGRFDLAFNGVDPPKLLEYNADTPTTLLEAAVVQWHWLQDFRPEADQFNSIWEGLVECWQDLKEASLLKNDFVHFASADSVEDFMTIMALQDTATEAGLTTDSLLMDEIGWDSASNRFVDLNDRPIESIFKLYPWEWMVREEFSKPLFEHFATTCWIEPIWKMVLSNKALLPIMWRLFPDNPYILEAYFDDPQDMSAFVSKPLLGREGANVTITRDGSETSNPGEYGTQKRIYQKFVELPQFDDRCPVIGSWVIDGASRGMGIRESLGPITTNTSPFVPHLFS